MQVKLFDRSGELVSTEEIPDARTYPDIIVLKVQAHRRFFQNTGKEIRTNQFTETFVVVIEK